jgi:hypothetical protein
MICLISFLASKGQTALNTMATVSISSPNAASLGKFGDIPVGYHTGTPSVNIPLYTVQAGPLKLPIGLSYHASGLKVMEPASWVGAGWALDAGGVITRTIQGLPDEAGGNDGAQIDGHFSQNGYNSYLYETGQQDWKGFVQGRKDGEPDLFFFNFAGYSGKFYFRDDRIPVIVPEQDLKIIPVWSGGRSMDNFTIVTPEGTKYIFGNSAGVTGVTPIEKTNCYSAASGAESFPPTSSWFLNQVVSADGQFTIQLKYEAESYGYFTYSLSKVDYPINPYSGMAIVKNLIQGVRLSKITFPNGMVNFFPGDVRTDLSDDVQGLADNVNTSAKTLGSIQITDSITLCKNYNFAYAYTTPDGASLPTQLTAGYAYTADEKRLLLSSVQEISCDASAQAPPYQFTYSTTNLTPRRLSLGVDHWGYFNAHHADNVNANNLHPGQTPGLIPTITVGGTTTNGANRDAAWPQMLYGSLTRVDYPTGGHTSMDFESNTALVSTSSIVDGYRAAFALNVFGQNAVQPSESFVSNGNDLTLSYTSTCNWGTRFEIVDNTANTVPYDVELNNGNPTNPFVSSGSLNSILFPAGHSFTVSAVIDNTGNAITGGISIHVTQKEVQTVTSNVLLGGIRINKMTVSDGTSGNDMVTNYSYTTPGGSQTSVLYSVPTYVQQIRNDLIANVGYWGTSGFTNYTFGSNGCPGGYIVSPGTLRPMATVQGSIIGYSMVTVSKPGNGSSVYSYYTVDQGFPTTLNAGFAVTIASGNCESSIPNYPSAPLPFVSKRGELQSEQHYDNTGKLLKNISYTPQFDLSPVLPTPAFIVQASVYSGSTRWLGTFYNLNTVRKTSMQIAENDFGTNGGILTKNTTITYGSAFHNQPTSTVTSTSTGETLTSKTSYVSDLRLSACDAIPDGSTDYNNACTTCTSTFNTARVNCGSDGSCLTTAYENYLQCNTNARIAYVNTRNTNYMGTSNAFGSCHLSAENNADPLLKPFLTLQDAAINTSVESSEWRNANLKHASFTSYALTGSPNLFPYPAKTQTLNLSATSSSFSPAAISGSTVAVDGRYTDEASYRFQAGNAVQVTAHDGVPTCYIWDYSNQKPIAKVVNATIDQVAYTSFEADGNGGWNIPSTDRRWVNPVTGNVTYHMLSGDITKSGLDPNKTYILSYWGYGSGGECYIPGTTQVRYGKTTAGEYQYYEHTITGVSTIDITGWSTVDELRLYPADAQMTTYTYAPIVGITSQCDVGNRVLYYYYDALGRLQFKKDQDLNIVETYQYHYKGQ